MGEHYTAKLADFCADLSYDSVPLPAIQQMKWALLDNIGVITGASATEEGSQFADFVSEFQDREEATAIGFGFRSSMRNTAFLNGTMSELLELQDGYTKGGVHACCGVISASLACAEYLEKGGKDLLLANIVGYEVANRVAEVMHPSHLARGFQPTGTAGAIGAAAAAGKLMGFDRNQMYNAIGIAAFILPVSTGDNLWGGYTIKPVHGGAAAKAGIESALLAQKGFTACSLEGDPKLNKGFCVIVSDKPNFEKMIDKLGEKYTINDVYFKPYSCCRINHSPVEITLDLAQRNKINPTEVKSILVRTYQFAAAVPGSIRTISVSSMIDCQFSTAYCVAAALMDGRVGLEQFVSDRIRDPRIHQLADRVSIIADEELENLRPANRPAIVEISLKNGKEVSGRVDYPKGDSRKPMSDAELIQKFESLASHMLSEEKVNRIQSTVMDLEQITHVGKLIQLCI